MLADLVLFELVGLFLKIKFTLLNYLITLSVWVCSVLLLYLFT